MAYSTVTLKYGGQAQQSINFLGSEFILTSVDLGSPENEFYTLLATTGYVVTGSHLGSRDIVLEGYILPSNTRDAIDNAHNYQKTLSGVIGGNMQLTVNSDKYACRIVSPMSFASDPAEANKDFCKFQLMLRAFSPNPT